VSSLLIMNVCPVIRRLIIIELTNNLKMHSKYEVKSRQNELTQA